MARTLKVFRTAIGFHDAYVAAPTKKAALEAWGADRNLFASGRAELVEDSKLTKSPLAKPGTVIKVLRGSAAEQFAALETLGRKPDKKRAKGRTEAAPVAAAKPPPRPSRKALDRAEADLSAADKRHEDQLARLAKREEALRQQRREMERDRDRDLEARQAKIEALRRDYDGAMRAWRGD